MSGQDLMSELSAKVSLVDSALRQLGARGRERAKAEHDYRVALSKKILIERDKGNSRSSLQARLCRCKLQIRLGSN